MRVPTYGGAACDAKSFGLHNSCKQDSRSQKDTTRPPFNAPFMSIVTIDGEIQYVSLQAPGRETTKIEYTLWMIVWANSVTPHIAVPSEFATADGCWETNVAQTVGGCRTVFHSQTSCSNPLWLTYDSVGTVCAASRTTAVTSNASGVGR